MAFRGKSPSLLPLLWLASTGLPSLVSGLRSIASGSASNGATVSVDSKSSSDWCKRWLLVQYKEEPNVETEEMPARGVFHYPAGEWGNRLLFTKSLANGCTKTYTAVCSAGTGALRVVSSCPDQPSQVGTRGFGGFITTRNSHVGHGETVQVALPGEARTVVLTSGKVKVTPMKVGVCRPVTTQQDFDLMSYISKPWYIQQQAVTTYLPLSWNYCLSAEYTALEEGTFWGYTIGVRNLAYEVDGTVHDSGDLLRAYGTDKYDPAKLAVAPYFIPKFLSGDYWVIAYNEEEGYGLVSGGQPTIETRDGFCRTNAGVNEAGLWIFTRARKRDEALVQKVREIARAQGFDLSVLNDVNQTNCKLLPSEKQV